MTDSIAGLPFWDLVFDAEGDTDGASADALIAEVKTRSVTDLYVFSHGWNNERRTARRLYEAFFGLLAAQLAATAAGPAVTAGLAGVFWPAKRWSDEPIPDFTPGAGAPGAGAAGAPSGAGSAGVASGGAAAATLREREPVGAPVSQLDDQTLADLLATFPASKAVIERMAALLDGPATEEAQTEFFAHLQDFAAIEGLPEDDGETAEDTEPGVPRMLSDQPRAVFDRYADALRLPPSAGGEAGIGDFARRVWSGAKEALRQATYWEMKSRAGVVGRKGLGPLLGRLATEAPQVRVHLIGHSFGARLVSYALAGLPAGRTPVKSVTLLQGAFSHFAFTRPLPFDAGRSGALAGMQTRIDGPLTVCFSRHDGAVGTFYPLASMAARDDSAGAEERFYRWGGMGADGAQNDDARLDAIRPAGATYRFSRDHILNIDAAEVVRRGAAPTGAHSDIVHPELTWVVLAASRS
jgi:hypothetical protein